METLFFFTDGRTPLCLQSTVRVGKVEDGDSVLVEVRPVGSAQRVSL